MVNCTHSYVILYSSDIKLTDTNLVMEFNQHGILDFPHPSRYSTGRTVLQGKKEISVTWNILSKLLLTDVFALAATLADVRLRF